MNFINRLLYRPFFIKLFNWEYWSFNVVYGPIYLYWVWLCIKARTVFFFNTSNPLITNGGFLLESKKAIFDIIPPAFYPKTLFFSTQKTPQTVCKVVEDAGFCFPLIGKPDIGMQGLSVKKISNFIELAQYAANSLVDFLIQEFIPYENEIGLFYYRYPNEENGQISGIVGKEFLTVTGDGNSTVEQLLQKDKRHILQINSLKKLPEVNLKKILPLGEAYLMVPYGNHARGSKFLDFSHKIDEQLTQVVDAFCKQIPQFYFGRMDIRYNTWEELKQGKAFSIVELNGAGSEPTHMYDPKHSIFFAWKEIIRHWNILHKVSVQNHKTLGLPYMSFKEGMQMLKQNRAYVQFINGRATAKQMQ